jgi:PTH1 family peptidyl-tRNA hydrolase
MVTDDIKYRVIVGLGNPGKEYEMTRHNIGFLIVDCLLPDDGKAWRRHECGCLMNEINIDDKSIHLVKPLTYMNRSGMAVRGIIDNFSLPLSSILVVHDDIDVPLGQIRYRFGGSDGGHLGVRSVIETVGGSGFTRLRVGIDRPSGAKDTALYVLSRFSEEEMDVVKKVVSLSCESIIYLLKNGLSKTMNRYNRKQIEPGIKTSETLLH